MPPDLVFWSGVASPSSAISKRETEGISHRHRVRESMAGREYVHASPQMRGISPQSQAREALSRSVCTGETRCAASGSGKSAYF